MNTNNVLEQLQAEAYVAIRVTAAIGDAIRELGTASSVNMYAQLSGYMSLEAFQRIISTLVRAGLVRRAPNNLLVWTGPHGGPASEPNQNQNQHQTI